MNRDFRRLWAAEGMSNVGTSFTTFGLPLVVYRLTKSPVGLAAASAAALAPVPLLGLAIGAYVDRADRRRLMVRSDLANAAVIGTIPVLALVGALHVWWLYAVAFANAALGLVFQFSQFTVVPQLVEPDDLTTANGRLVATSSGASVAGPVLAGALVLIAPLESVFLVDSLSFFASALLLTSIRQSFGQAEDAGPRRRLRVEIREGLSYVFHHPLLRQIALMMALLNLFNSALNAQLVLFGERELHLSSGRIGVLFAFESAGVVLVSLAAGPLRKRMPYQRIVLPTLIIDGALAAAFSAVHRYWAAALLWMLIGGLPLLIHVNNQSLRQEIVPARLLGRVVGVAGVLAWSAAPVGVVAAGWVIAATGDVRLMYLICGALISVIGVAFCFSPLARFRPEDRAAFEASEAEA